MAVNTFKTVVGRPAYQGIDEATPGKLESNMQVAKVGSGLLGSTNRFMSEAVVNDTLVLEDSAKAMQILSATATVGTLTGALTAAALGVAPASGEIGISATGNILFNAADAITRVEVVYIPFPGSVVTEVITVLALGTAALLGNRSALVLLSASLDATADAPGAKTIVERTAVPAAGEAAITAAGSLVFNAADVGADTRTATVKYVAAPGVGSVDASFHDRLMTPLVD